MSIIIISVVETMVIRNCYSGSSESKEDTASKVTLDEVKAEWKMLWRNRIDDKVRAEGIAKQDYSLLSVDQGTVIVATKDFKPVDLKEILSSYEIQNGKRRDLPHPSVGGYGKFARTVLNKQTRAREWKATESVRRKKNKKILPKKKGGRGWLHK